MGGSPKATTNTPSARQPARHAPPPDDAHAAGTRDRRRPDPGPPPVRSLSDRRAHAVQSRRTAYRHWHEETQELVAERQRWIDQHIGRDRSQDQGLDYGIDL